MPHGYVHWLALAGTAEGPPQNAPIRRLPACRIDSQRGRHAGERRPYEMQASEMRPHGSVPKL